MRFFPLFLVLFLNCSVFTDEQQLDSFPYTAKLEGFANGEDQDKIIDCGFDFTLERDSSDESLLKFHGDAFRAAINSEGEGVGLFGFAQGELSIYFSPGDSITLTSTRFEPVNIQQFWEEFFLFEGEKVQFREWNGNWQCRPFFTRGDSVGTVAGVWTIKPEG